MFSTAATPLYIPINNAHGFQFLHVLVNMLPDLLGHHKVSSFGTVITDPSFPLNTQNTRDDVFHPWMPHNSTPGYVWASGLPHRLFRSF